MRIGPQAVVGTVVGAVAGLLALAQWKAKAEAFEAENNDLKGRTRGLESQRNSLKSNNDALKANNLALSDEIAKLRARA